MRGHGQSYFLDNVVFRDYPFREWFKQRNCAPLHAEHVYFLIEQKLERIAKPQVTGSVIQLPNSTLI